MNDQPRHGTVAAPLIRVLDTDRATHDLLQEWLTSAGFSVTSGSDWTRCGYNGKPY